jgi:hypothetical protein
MVSRFSMVSRLSRVSRVSRVTCATKWSLLATISCFARILKVRSARSFSLGQPRRKAISSAEPILHKNAIRMLLKSHSNAVRMLLECY